MWVQLVKGLGTVSDYVQGEKQSLHGKICLVHC